MNPGDGDGGGGGGDSSLLPDWVTSLKPLVGYSDDIVNFFKNPTRNIREVISGMILGGVAFFVEPWFDTILLIAAGSQPTKFAAQGEVYGIADIPVAFARAFGSVLAVPVEVFTSTLAGVIADATPASEGPIEGLIMTVLVAGTIYLLAKYGPVVALALIETVPTVGPPLARLLKGLR